MFWLIAGILSFGAARRPQELGPVLRAQMPTIPREKRRNMLGPDPFRGKSGWIGQGGSTLLQS